jgi:hypothetical protein
MRVREDRRAFLAAGAGLAGVALSGELFALLAQQVIKDVRDLKPGEFTWHPERSPEGPLAIIVSVPDQRVHVYRNGVRIAVSTCSTGAPGHSTPTGVFTILQKDKNHHSRTYDNAPMPNMNRLTWSGIALHAGKLPGYPASHGCIRLPLEFSARLFGITQIGTPVIIAGGHNDPNPIVHPGLVLSNYAEDEFDKAVTHLDGKAHPKDWDPSSSNAVTTVIVSRAQRKVLVLENGRIVAEGEAAIREPDQPLGSHLYVLQGADNAVRGLAWHAIAFNGQLDTAAELIAAGELQRVKAAPDVNAAIQSRMHPGMLLLLTDLPAEPDTRTNQDFVVMDGPAV